MKTISGFTMQRSISHKMCQVICYSRVSSASSGRPFGRILDHVSLQERRLGLCFPPHLLTMVSWNVQPGCFITEEAEPSPFLRSFWGHISLQMALVWPCFRTQARRYMYYFQHLQDLASLPSQELNVKEVNPSTLEMQTKQAIFKTGSYAPTQAHTDKLP